MISIKYSIFFLVSVISAIGNSIDSSTYANIQEVASNHLDLELNVDFNTTTITGSVTHNMTILAENVESIFFDSTSLNISKVLFVTDDISTEMNYTLTTPNNKLGDALEVKLAETLPVGR